MQTSPRIRALIDTTATITAWQEWRITNPYTYMKSYSIDAEWMWCEVGDNIEADILVLPRLVVGTQDQQKIGNWFYDLKAKGVKIVYECDDDIFSPYYVQQLTKCNWLEAYGREALIATIDEFDRRSRDAKWVLSHCDAVTVSTKSLGIYVQTLTDKPVHVIPNALDVAKFSKGLKPKLDGPKTIGWAGGSRIPEDLEIMTEAWIRVAQNSDAHFVVAGWKNCPILTNKWLANRITHIPWASTESYASGLQVDIGCVSVSNNPFNLCKSPIKAWEYAIAGASVVGSKLVYGDEPLILLCETVDDWVDHIEYLLNHDLARCAMRSAYRKHVELNHDLSTEWHVWLDTYVDIINGR